MIKIFIDAIKAVNLLAFFIIAVGAYYFATGQKEGFPNIGLDIITITVPYPGLSANEVEASITRKLEDVIDKVEGKDSMTSYSTEGNSTIVFQVDIDAGRSMSEVLDDIETAIDSVKGDLPEEALDPIVRELTFQNNNPVIRVGISGNADIATMKNIIDTLYDNVGDIVGVGKVEKSSYPESQVWIEAKPQQMRNYDLEISDINRAVRDNNITLPAGRVTIGSDEYLIKTQTKFQNLADIENIIVRGNDGGQVVRIKNVANVSYNYEELPVITRMNGKNSMWVNIYQASNGDIISIADEAKKELAALKTQGLLPAGVTTHISDDFSFYVKRRLGILAQNATFGLILVFICLILFFEFRITFWTTLGIPFSFCLAIIATYSMGITLNLMSMFGFIIVLGMIVDDAIIVAENVYQKVENGLPGYQAAIDGTKEMLLPLVAITATTIVAFLPLMTLPGIFGKVLGIIPLVVIFTMLASFVECILILPGHLAHSRFSFSSQHKISTTTGKPQKSRVWFTVLRSWYKNFITKVVQRPVRNFAIITISIMGLAVFSAMNVGFKFFPGSLEEVRLNLEMPISNNIEKTTAKVDEVEFSLRKSPVNAYIREYISTAGQTPSGGGSSKVRTYLANIRLVLNPEKEITAKKLVDMIKKEVTKISGIEKFTTRQRQSGPPAGDPIDVSFYSDDLNKLNAISAELEEFLNNTANVTSVKTSIGEGKDELLVKINQLEASISGITVAGTAAALRRAFSGTSSTTANSMDGRAEDIEVVVKYPEKEIKDISENLSTIKRTVIKNNRGFNVPLQNFSQIVPSQSFDVLNKEEKKLFVSVSGDLSNLSDSKNNSTTIGEKTEVKINSLLKKYPGVSYELKGEQEQQSDLMFGIIRAVLLSLSGIFFVLTVIFRSYLQPFMIMAILPYTIMGVAIGLFINNTPIGLMPFLGIIALTGIVVNDSLVMVNRINKLRRSGVERVQAIIDGSTSRLRPILMTSITTVVGVTPLAYGLLGSEPFLAPMAITLLSGLLFSTFFLLVVFPLIYLLIDGLALWFYTKILRTEYHID